MGRPVIDLTGDRYGRLVVLHVVRLAGDKRAWWMCRCDCGNEVVVRSAVLRQGKQRRCSRMCEFRNLKQYVGYSGAHMRVRVERGSASEHDCIDCGGPALEWSYDHKDPNEIRGVPGKGPFSNDPYHYEPRCKTCHVAFDMGVRA